MILCIQQSHLEIKQKKKKQESWRYPSEWWSRPIGSSINLPRPPLPTHIWKLLWFYCVCIYEPNLLESNTGGFIYKPGSGPLPMSPLGGLVPSADVSKRTIVIVSGETPERFSMRWLSARRLLCDSSVTSKAARRRQSEGARTERWGRKSAGGGGG